jgi:hypothetical protein
MEFGEKSSLKTSSSMEDLTADEQNATGRFVEFVTAVRFPVNLTLRIDELDGGIRPIPRTSEDSILPLSREALGRTESVINEKPRRGVTPKSDCIDCTSIRFRSSVAHPRAPGSVWFRLPSQESGRPKIRFAQESLHKQHAAGFSREFQ